MKVRTLLQTKMPSHPTANTKRHELARELLKAINDTSQSARTSWLFFITLTAYLFVAIASVTHADILLNSPVKLPILQIDIGIRSFFVYAPVLYIFVHFGVLLHHSMLVRKATALNDLLNEGEDHTGHPDPLRMEISSYFFAQNVAGPERGTLLHFLLRLMSLLTLGILPLFLVLYFQIAYLPAHDSEVTIVHRLYVLIDVGVLLLNHLARRIPDLVGWRNAIWTITRRSFLIDLFSCLFALFISFLVATIPMKDIGDLDQLMAGVWPTKVPFDPNNQTCAEWRGDRCAFWLTALIFEQPIDYVSARQGWLSRNLVITNKQDLLPKRDLREGEVRFTLRGRDLRYATFDRSDLHRVDFTATDLSGASLKGTDLREAIFSCAIKGKKSVVREDEDKAKVIASVDDQECPKLIGADLSEAKLTFNGFRQAEMNGIILKRLNLQGFDFKGRGLAGADFSRSDLRGANFTYANLNGAILSNVAAEGALFLRTSLQGSDLRFSHLDGSSFNGANLSGARLLGASLFATDFSEALLFGSELAMVRIWYTIPSAPSAYTLAHTSDLKFNYPTNEELLRTKELEQIMKRDVTDPEVAAHYQEVRDRLAGLQNREQDWKASNNYRVWAALENETDRERSLDQMAGRYLGDVACDDVDVFRRIVQRWLPLNTEPFEFESYPGSKIVLPPGLTKKDLAAISLRYDDGYFGGGWDEEFGTFGPATAISFYARVSEAECLAARQVPPAMLYQLGRRIELLQHKTNN